MNLIKRITAAVLVFCLALSLTGCGDTTWIAKIDGQTVPSGLYIYYQTDGYGDALYKLYQEDDSYLYQYLYFANYRLVMPELFETQLSTGETVEEHMNQYALDMCKQSVVVDKLFEELELELSDDDMAIIDNRIRNEWTNNGSSWEEAGVSEASLKLALLSSYKEEKVFDKYYEIGGLNGTTEEEIEDYFADNYARIKYMTFTFADSIDDAVDEARKTEQLDLANSYVERVNAGESMDDLIEEHNAELEAAAAEDTDDGTDEDAEADTDDTADTADADSEDDTAEEEVEVTDEYANETILSKDGKYPTEKFVSYVFSSCNVGETTVIQDDLCFYVVQRLDILERDGLYDDYRDSILTELFDSDYTKLMNDRLSGYNVEINDRSVKRYKAKNAFPELED